MVVLDLRLSDAIITLKIVLRTLLINNFLFYSHWITVAQLLITIDTIENCYLESNSRLEATVYAKSKSLTRDSTISASRVTVELCLSSLCLPVRAMRPSLPTLRSS